jgi:hypothetical protein
MATFSGQITFPAGVTDSPVVVVPPGVTGCDISLTVGGWPVGTYQLDVMLSQDGGLTFPLAASITMPSPPITFRNAPYHLHFDVPAAISTHDKGRITAPASFTTTIMITPS